VFAAAAGTLLNSIVSLVRTHHFPAQLLTAGVCSSGKAHEQPCLTVYSHVISLRSFSQQVFAAAGKHTNSIVSLYSHVISLRSFSQQVFAAAGAKPVIIVTISGGMVSIDQLISNASAIVDAFNPAQKGPLALAALLMGHENRWGKLPITIYNSTYTDAFKIQDMSFHTPPGRSYRYYEGTPLFKFGSGLSYTTCVGTHAFSRSTYSHSLLCQLFLVCKLG
jgi:hypothetical protein